MFEPFILPFLLQLTFVPEQAYEPQFSDEARAVVDTRDDVEAEVWIAELEQLAQQGDDSALEMLGEIYSFALFYQARDPRRACDYFYRQGGRRPDGLHNLATCYYNGDGRPQDRAKARELYVEAAQAGWTMAFCAYGNMLVRGEGGAVNAEEGVRLCRMTAVAGDADAQTDYGTYLLTGRGIERDPATARFMLEQAARQEQRNAAFLLGQIHTRGDGTPVNHAAASEWFEKAFSWGRRDAAFEAGRSYLRRGYVDEGDGQTRVSPGLLRSSIVWFQTAAEVEAPGSQRRGDALRIIQTIDEILGSAASVEPDSNQ